MQSLKFKFYFDFIRKAESTKKIKKMKESKDK